MDKNSMAIIVMCSHLCTGENVKPFEPAEWTRFAERLLDKEIEPYELMSFSVEDLKAKLDSPPDEARRITRLIERSGSISFEIEKYAGIGINIMTRADAHYPRALKKKLGKSCPPIFYYAGNPELAESKCVGIVGSRSIGLNDEAFTAATVKKVNSKGFGVVSGGAKGVDSVASEISIANGSCSVEYISDSLIRRIKDKAILSALINDQLLILSAVNPDSGFFAGFAMMRNKYIYAQSEGTVIIKSDYNKGGTWSGAVANLKQQLCSTFCWNNPEHEGNIELIRRGAIPIDESWGADLTEYKFGHMEVSEQLSFFNRSGT
jgi:predicted Rossmann fold nucleotide-binding protein DprA/Smf involved in DNA uptake